MGWFSSGLLGSSPPAFTPTIIDDFETDDSAYDYTEDATSYTYQTTTFHSGSQALEIDCISSGFDVTVSTGTGATTLNHYPTFGEPWEIWFYLPGTADGIVDMLFFIDPNSVGVNEPPNSASYRIGFDDITMREWNGGSPATNSTLTTQILNANEWYRIVTTSNSDGSSVTGELFDSSGTSLASTSITPLNTLYDGTFGWRTFGNRADNFIIDDIKTTN